MKAFFRLAALVTSICVSLSLPAQRTAPCLCIPADPAWTTATSETQKCTNLTPAVPPVATPSDNKITLEVKDDPSDLDPYPDARYKAFWMWGDGNFRYFPHGRKADDLLTYKQSYVYSRPGNFTPVVILTEKKSDKAPPGRMERSIQINQTRTSPTPFEKRLNVSGKTADIFSTEDLRAGGFHTALVVSAPKNIRNTGVFFFYNSIYNRAKNVHLAAPVHKIVSVEVPQYAKDAGLSMQEGPTTNLKNPPIVNWLPNPTLINALAAGYQNYIFLPMTGSALEVMSPGFDEYRYFPVLETIWPDTLSEAEFLTLVVGSSIPTTVNDNVPDPFYDAKRISELRGTLSSVITDYDTTGLLNNMPENFLVGTATDNAGNSSNVYVRGAARQSVRLVGSIDPNELEVEKICPTEAGKYKAYLRLQICNEGYMFENSITVRMIDAGNHFSNIDIPQAVKNEFNGTFREETAPQHFWSFVWGKHLDGIYDASNPNDDYAPSCAEFRFTIETDWAGVQKLQAGNGIEMCVTFSNSIPKKEICGFYNYPIGGQVTQAYGYECGGGGTTPTDCCCNWLAWLLFAIAALLLVLWWWFRNSQNNPTNP